MIFVTVGMQLPFDRLMKAMDDWCAVSGRGREVFGQTCHLGRENYAPKNFAHVEELASDEFMNRLSEAQVIVSHAGMGTIISALMLSKPIILLPRRAALGEQRNDHQLATVQEFAARPGVVISKTEAELPGVLDRILKNGTKVDGEQPSPYAQDSLISEIRRVIFGPSGEGHRVQRGVPSLGAKEAGVSRTLRSQDTLK
jgi:UDP-N-acetylglucosamine transferase subunit ALG13